MELTNNRLFNYQAQLSAPQPAAPAAVAMSAGPTAVEPQAIAASPLVDWTQAQAQITAWSNQLAAIRAQLQQMIASLQPQVATPAPSAAPVPQAPAQPVPQAPAPRPQPVAKPKPKPKPKPGKGPMLSAGARGVPVKKLEQRLTDLGYHVGTPDRVMGKATVKAVKRFQKKHHLEADGVVGPKTWRPLQIQVKGKVKYPGPNPKQIARKLRVHLNNPEKGVVHHCFAYAWATVTRAGGKSIGSARQLHAGRWNGLGSLSAMVQKGQIKVGDIIYCNYRPGADPTSTNLAYGPHWFVYIGKGQFADQYGVRSGAAMNAFVPGRKIDTIYRTFGK
jgi:hypothetical protein